MRKYLLTGLLGAAMCVGAFAADVVVKLKPPAVRVEKRPPSPGAGYVWVGGYHRWDGHGYVWTPGEWRRPPHEHATWVAPRWEHRNGGYVFVDGRWK